MPHITFTELDGTRHDVKMKSGQSVMEGAVRNDIPGIDADCGGACACATCHVYIDDAWRDRVGPPTDTEASMLEFAENAHPASRLSCQIKMSEALDGLIVVIPPERS